MTPTIRPADVGDASRLQDIEIRAGLRFAEVGLAEIAAHDPFSADDIALYVDAGRAWVAELDDEVVGYLVVDVVDGNAHVEQVSVDPRHQGAGIGRALMDQADVWARATGRHAVTLTTFTHVEWNAPLYEHLGFEVLEEADIGPELRALRAEEARHGLDPTIRVCMRKSVTN